MPEPSAAALLDEEIKYEEFRRESNLTDPFLAQSSPGWEFEARSENVQVRGSSIGSTSIRKIATVGDTGMPVRESARHAQGTLGRRINRRRYEEMCLGPT